MDRMTLAALGGAQLSDSGMSLAQLGDAATYGKVSGGLLAVLGQTRPAQMAKGILDAVQLPGQVAGGLLGVQPSQPGMWSDVDEARQQANQSTMMDRAADLGGLVMGGSYGLARPVPNSLGMGVRSLPSDNYVSQLSRYSNKLYRETSPEEALGVLPGSNVYHSSGPIPLQRQYYADTPDLALGQGSNRGVRVGYDASAFEGKINQSKPGWDHMFQQGSAEYMASPMKDADVRGAVNYLSVDKAMLRDAPGWVQARYKNVQDALRQAGWEMKDTPTSVEWVRPK